MKSVAILLPLALLLATNAFAQAQASRMWRCGNMYTNDQAVAQNQGCKLVEGGNVTVVEGTRVHGATPVSTTRVAVAAPAAPQRTERVEQSDQKARDADARLILEAELKKAESRQAELQKEWNNGEPERRGDERNYQKYLDRKEELKASLARNENDLAGLRRELARLPGGTSAAAK